MLEEEVGKIDEPTELINNEKQPIEGEEENKTS